METYNFSKSLKPLYTAGKNVAEVRPGKGTFIAVDERGAPGGDAFGHAMQAMYGTLFTMKFTIRAEGRFDFKIGAVECVYLSACCDTPMDEWEWRVMVRIPDAVTAADVRAAHRVLREKKGLDATAARRLQWNEPRALQLLHVGPYDKLGESYGRLAAEAAERGLAACGPAHEIYLSDPRRTAPERLKTIARLGVK